ncbi:unnamed protein product [Phytophthora lilii]|uniref:Unnamed protein product n=1 Tax=Phytophthora lilii TaxID=2077276 RepID=A0A9W7CLX5_9STRA|nr:unnamed protein product [Phytophthora lilii]
MGFFGGKFAMDARRRHVSIEKDHLLPPSLTPGYAAGEVFVDSVLDTLLCQSFFNPYAVDLIRALAGDYYSDAIQHSSPNSDQTAFKASMMRYFSTITPSTSSLSENDTEGSRSSRKSTAPELGGEQSSYCRYPVLRVATVSRKLTGEAFAEVFTRALRQQILVVGLYRRAGQVALPYVVLTSETAS